MHNGRVEVIPATAMEFILCRCGRLNLSVMPEMGDDLQQQYLDALGVFIDKYEPAKKNEVTDYFSSVEINHLIHQHTGVDIELLELHKLMVQMGFNYELQEHQFVWSCCNKQNQSAIQS